MPHTATPQPLFTLCLRATQRAWERVPSGADIAVLEGAVRLHRITYLAGMWVELPLLLRAGERHRVEVAGWVQIEAVGAAKLSAVARQPGGRGWLAVAVGCAFILIAAYAG